MPAPLTPDLMDIPLFSGLTESQKAEIVEGGELLMIERGEALIRQNDPAEALFIVTSGRFVVTRDAQSAWVGLIGPGQPIGEIGFLNGGVRTATVTALRDSVVLALDRQSFTAVAARHPGIWHALSQTLASRLAETTARAAEPMPEPRPRTIAIIPAGKGPLPDAFLNMLIAEFAATAKTRVVRSGGISRLSQLGPNPMDGGSGETLDALEKRFDYVLLLSDPDDAAWSEKILHHADLVLLVADYDADPAPSPLEAVAERYLDAAHRRLVLLHPAKRRLSGTARWLAPRAVAMHHHVALDSNDGVARLVRFIHGTAKGLVACGGGALCAAHVGVYKALLEHGETFDIMGGTSAGAAMVAGFLLGTPPDDMDRAIHDMFVVEKAMRTYTLPRYSLLDHANFDRQLAAFFGGTEIEDMWLPFFAVSTNLSRNERFVHRQGSLWSAVRASASIPALLPPLYTEDGEMLVDGCLIDNVPVKTMHDLKTGPNIVVSFTLPELDRYTVDYQAMPSRLNLIGQSLLPGRRRTLPDAPGPMPVLIRSLMAGRQDFQRFMCATDRLMVPPIPADMGFLDWHRHREVFDLAYQWAKTAR